MDVWPSMSVDAWTLSAVRYTPGSCSQYVYSKSSVRLVQASTKVLFSLLANSPSCTHCRSIVKDDLFGPVFTVFLANGPRYNMLNSSKRSHCLASCHFTRRCRPPLPFKVLGFERVNPKPQTHPPPSPFSPLPTLFSQIVPTPTFKQC